MGLKSGIFHQPFEVARPPKNEPPFFSGSPLESGPEKWFCTVGEAFTEVTKGFKVWY